jgi:hypothetical protein
VNPAVEPSTQSPPSPPSGLTYRRLYRFDRRDWPALIRIIVFAIIAGIAGFYLIASLSGELRVPDSSKLSGTGVGEGNCIAVSFGVLIASGVGMIRAALRLAEHHHQRMETLFPPRAQAIRTELPEFLRRAD